jgi:hypothetical protein
MPPKKKPAKVIEEDIEDVDPPKVEDHPSGSATNDADIEEIEVTDDEEEEDTDEEEGILADPIMALFNTEDEGIADILTSCMSSIREELHTQNKILNKIANAIASFKDK